MKTKTSAKVSTWLVVALAVLGISAACGDSPSSETDDRQAAEQEEKCPVGADIGVPELDDAQIAQVVLTLNLGEVQQGQLAQQQASLAEVRAYGDRMVQEHTQANSDLEAALQTLGVTPRESPLSRQLAAETNQALEILRTASSGEDFDRAYMDLQVAMHAKALFLMDTVILPRIQQQELRELARMARGQVQTHLADAVPIQASIPPSP